MVFPLAVFSFPRLSLLGYPSRCHFTIMWWGFVRLLCVYIKYERIGIRGRAGFFSFSHLPSFFSLFFFLFSYLSVPIYPSHFGFIELFFGLRRAT